MERIKSIFTRITGSKHFRRYSPLGIVLIIAVITFTTCVPKEDPEEELESVPYIINEEPAPVESEPPSEPMLILEPGLVFEPVYVYSGPLNPLTGLPTVTDISNNRPLAIMVNNNIAAQPQHGISRADIIYEVVVEGGITRMMALFQDVSSVGVIGSIRSSRLYYVDLVQGYDAIYIFAGGSPEAYTALSRRNITRLDGTAGHEDIYYRDQQRRVSLGSEHSLMTTGARISQRLPTYGFRLEHEAGYTRALSFTEDGTPSGGEPANDFSVRFSSSKTTSFSYLESDGLYYLGQFGRSYKDGNDDTQLAFTNVLILKTSISRIPGDSEGRMRVATTGSGTGYFVCGGSYVEIEWSREEPTSQFTYKLSDGSELVFGQGRTYICIIANDMNVDFS